MPIPGATHLQFLVLSVLMDGERSGREIRAKLDEQGQKKSGPAFYQFMARLEEARLVVGRYEQKVVDGQIIKERRYELTGDGLRAWEEVRDFYLVEMGLGLSGGLAR